MSTERVEGTTGECSSPLPGCGGVYVNRTRRGDDGRTQKNVRGRGNGGRTQFAPTGVRGSLYQNRTRWEEGGRPQKNVRGRGKRRANAVRPYRGAGEFMSTERVEGTTGERRRTYWDGGNGGRTQFTHTARNIHVGGEGQRANAEERTGTGNGGRTKFTHTGVRGSLCQPNA